jgi:hypothetical protein
MAKEKMMPYMDGYNRGYIPPKGSAGGEAFGEWSYKTNPRTRPERGSQIGAASEFGQNADRMKLMSLKEEEMKKESLRGYGS